MKPVKDLTIMVVDYGLFVEIARRLARDVAKVYYAVPWEDSFPMLRRASIGHGWPEIERVDNVFGPWTDSVDLFVFPDINMGRLQTELVRQGRKVFGGRMGDEMENARAEMKQIMSGMGLDVGPWAQVTGVKALREHLQDRKDVWVKVPKWRGTVETFHVPNYRTIEPLLDHIENQLGPLKHIVDFIIEDSLRDCCEIGMDGWTVNGQYPKTMMGGLEIKDKAYLAAVKPYEEFPQEVRDFNDAIAPLFKRYGYAGAFSTEMRVNAEGKSYMIDFCARCGSPPSEIYQEADNLAEVMWAAANDEVIDPVFPGKFAAEIIMSSQWAEKQHQALDFPKEYRDNIKLRNAAFIDGRHYIINQGNDMPEIGAVIAWGDSKESAIEQVKEISGTIEGYDLDIPLHAFDAADEQLARAAEFGAGML